MKVMISCCSKRITLLKISLIVSEEFRRKLGSVSNEDAMGTDASSTLRKQYLDYCIQVCDKKLRILSIQLRY